MAITTPTPLIFCLVPRNLADAILEPLRRHFAPSGVAVIVEKRDGKPSKTWETRRAPLLPRELAELPDELHEYAGELKMVQRMEPVGPDLQDATLLEVVQAVVNADGGAATELQWRIHARVFARIQYTVGTHKAPTIPTLPIIGAIVDRLPSFTGESDGAFLAWVDDVVDVTLPSLMLTVDR